MIQLQDGAYAIGGIQITELVNSFDTPLYVYDIDIIDRQYSRLKQAFSSCKTRINFACKALNNVKIMRHLHDLGACLDTVSIQEVWLGLKAGFTPEEIIYTPNCVSMEEIDLAVKEGVMINIDNISILEQFGLKYGNTVPICIRINPHVMAGGNINISTGHID